MKLLNGDCLELMKQLPDGSVDMVLTDLPYGMTNCKWDQTIDLSLFWEQVDRVTKHNAAVGLFAKQPFATKLIMSNEKNFRYEYIWMKNIQSGFLNFKKMPLMGHENILVFYRKLPTFNPQRIKRTEKSIKQNKGISIRPGASSEGVYGKKEKSVRILSEDGTKWANTVLTYDCVPNNTKIRINSTQKPVPLLEHLIKTYTNEGETVLDATMGSGSTGVACINLNRNFIGIEKDEEMFNKAKEWLTSHQTDAKVKV